MLKGLIKKLKNNEENSVQNENSRAHPNCERANFLKLGKLGHAPEIVRGLRPAHPEFRTVYCIKNWITPEQEKILLENITRSSDLNVKLKGRSTQVWGGTVTSEGIENKRELPEWLSSIAQSLVETHIFSPETPPNHVLINQYELNMGILPHKDGPLYFPRVAIVSLESDVLFDFWNPLDQEKPHSTSPLFSLLVPRLSLLVFQDQCYSELLHGISSRNEDLLSQYNVTNLGDFPHLNPNSPIRRGFRTSLTFRHVKSRS
ncbi:alpha-ketoglutarate-dependent dioxygenase alkB 6 [Cryptosporidium felis]|nr:alpha-ketoglutarate-dependent dioxygenase alkB 6 [Cryptosporidium felis]